MKTPLGTKERRKEGKGNQDTPPDTVVPRSDTVINRQSNGHYSLRCIPSTTITVSEIRQTGLGTDLWIPVDIFDEDLGEEEDKEDDEGTTDDSVI